MSKTLQQIQAEAAEHVAKADANAVPVNLAFLARNAVEFQAAMVDVLTHVGVIEEPATEEPAQQA